MAGSLELGSGGNSVEIAESLGNGQTIRMIKGGNFVHISVGGCVKCYARPCHHNSALSLTGKIPVYLLSRS